MTFYLQKVLQRLTAECHGRSQRKHNYSSHSCFSRKVFEQKSSAAEVRLMCSRNKKEFGCDLSNKSESALKFPLSQSQHRFFLLPLVAEFFFKSLQTGVFLPLTFLLYVWKNQMNTCTLYYCQQKGAFQVASLSL